ncbi:hypothetical protein FEM48_Zijuj12G0171600 [Ziziphus jujuba var. spinosa]|uniref:Uncharacterized protein n=1 Tax=Ziziphus jujuba var. spinosa TaxID=714518 RepID=A0A978UEL1_ZIZJJ|nr:hypothetical protein FEM48_Zijuj12G0171600 [Ziziphus jujuba var. spinosa]
MILGIAVYLRLWTIDYTVSADDTELLRRQFDLANKEAMDESAEWRLKYDVEAERATKCLGELNKPSVPVILKLKIDLSSVTCLIGSFDFRLKLSSILQEHIKESYKKDEHDGNINQKLAVLKKENAALLAQVEALKQELESEKLKCSLP